MKHDYHAWVTIEYTFAVQNNQSNLKPNAMKNYVLKSAFCFLAAFTLVTTTYAQIGNIKKPSIPSKPQSTKTTESKKPEEKANSTKGEPSFAQITGKTIYVSKSGKSSNDGLTPATARKDIDRAIELAQKGDVIKVSQGEYSGTMDVCKFEITESITLMGGYNSDFTERNVVKHPTYIKAKANSAVDQHVLIIKSDKEGNGVTVDGFIFDMSGQNKYGKDIPEGLLSGYLPLTNQGGTPARSAIITTGNNHVIQNNVFVNIAKMGVSIRHNKIIPGKVKVLNNVFVVCADYSIEVFGLPGSQPNQEVEIANNTFALTFGSNFMNEDGGEAIYLKSEADYNVHHNVFAFSSGAGIRYTSKNTLKMNDNIFYANRRNDINTHLNNKRVFASADQFEDLPILTTSNDKREVVKLPLNQNYLNAFVNMASQTVSVEFDPNSDWNQLRSVLGLPLQSTGKVNVNFFANMYPLEETLKLFGSVSGYGAQIPTNN